MTELLALLSFYYICTQDAAAGLLTQQERFECNATYQDAKRVLLLEVYGLETEPNLTPSENVLAYKTFKAWEDQNAQLVAELKAQRPKR